MRLLRRSRWSRRASAVSQPSSAGTLPSSSCGPLFYKGSGKPQALIATDLPLQGAGRAQLIAMQQAVQFVLEKQFKFKAGKYHGRLPGL